MERKQFTFYRSYFEAVKELPKKEQCAVILAICAYALDEEEPKLQGTSKAVFTLIRPTLDTARKKAKGGSNGTPSKDNGKTGERQAEDSGKEKEGEKEKEIEKENECYPPNPLAEVMTAYMEKINPTPSQMSMDELKGYVEQMGGAVCLRAIDIALDAKKANWNYIRAILRDKLSKGVKCLADWDALDEAREKEAEQNGNIAQRTKPGELPELR